jgi:uncharacterized membrane protein YphA (DoxX/SURF4 family)
MESVKNSIYWIATALIALETLAGGWVDLTHGRTGVFNGPFVSDVVTGLGYPVYVLTILGILKIPGAITLVVPGFLRLKEWAYAGIVFELSAAAASHAICDHRSEVVAPVILCCLAVASWGLRPRSRILGGDLLARAHGYDTAESKTGGPRYP